LPFGVVDSGRFRARSPDSYATNRQPGSMLPSRQVHLTRDVYRGT
jgi:hypothetical protein